MIRPTSLLRSLPQRSRLTPAQIGTRRWASALHPTTASGPAQDVYGSPAEVALPTMQPGQEIDPQLAGYPQLPPISLQKRDPFGWWDAQERKNFGEVVQEEEDAIGMWGPDVHKISGGTALVALIAAFSTIGLLTYALTAVRPLRPVAAREYPYGGLEKELGGHVAARPEEENVDE